MVWSPPTFDNALKLVKYHLKIYLKYDKFGTQMAFLMLNRMAKTVRRPGSAQTHWRSLHRSPRPSSCFRERKVVARRKDGKESGVEGTGNRKRKRRMEEKEKREWRVMEVAPLIFQNVVAPLGVVTSAIFSE